MACLTTRPVVDIVTSRPRLDGVSTFRPTVPQASFMVSLFLYPVFKERHLRRSGRGRRNGERLLLSPSSLVKSFFDPTFSATLAEDERLHHRVGDGRVAVRSIVRASRRGACGALYSRRLRRPGSRREAGFNPHLISRQDLSDSFFQPLGGGRPGSRRRRDRRNRISPAGSARQACVAGFGVCNPRATSRIAERADSPGRRGAGAIASGSWVSFL